MGSTADNFQGQVPNINLQNFSNAIQGSTNSFDSSLQNQQQLAQILQNTASGQGPNPALSQLQAATNQNNQQAAGMLASQRGLNPALAARLASETAANNNQTAANQAATLQANQSLAAQGMLGNVYGQMGNQSLQAQSNFLNANAAQNNAINTGSLGAQKMTADAKAQESQNNTNIWTGIVGKAVGGIFGGSGGGLAKAAAHGGIIPGKANVPGDSIKNDTVPTILSPGEIVIPRSDASDPEKAKEFIDHLMSGKEKGEPKGYAKVLESHRKLQERMAELEKNVKGKKA